MKTKILYVITILMLVALVYFVSSSYALFESEKTIIVHPETAKWNIVINGKNINTIAYPYGSYNKDTIAITKENYDYAVTVNPGFNYSNNLSSKALNRFKVGRNMSINSFINMIGGNNE